MKAEQQYIDALLAQHRGEYEKARRSYVEILRVSPDHLPSRYMLGVLLGQTGQYLKSLEVLDSISASFKIDPRFHVNRARVLLSLDRIDEAIEAVDEATRLSPTVEGFRLDIAQALYDKGRHDEAKRQIDHLLRVEPECIGAYELLGRLFESKREWRLGLDVVQRGLRVAKDDADLLSLRGRLYLQLRNYGAAFHSFLCAFRQVSTSSEYASNVGSALHLMRRFNEAEEWHRKAISLDGKNQKAYTNLGSAFRELGRFDLALSCYDRALELDPEFSDAAFNKSILLLQLGRFEEAWSLYEWRFRSVSLNLRLPDGLGTQITDLADANQRRLLVLAEQGFGDTLQFCRYIYPLVDVCSEVIFYTPPRLLPLLRRSLVGVQFFTDLNAIPEHDFFVSLMSLPGLFKTSWNSFPLQIPYIHPSDDKISFWRDRVPSASFNIGVAWQGSQGSPVDSGRSFPVSCFHRISDLKSVRIFSLQRSVDSPDELAVASGVGVEFFCQEVDLEGAFVDTAAIIKNMDLVISSDTSIAHLAGAMGVRVFFVLKKIPDWRWLLERSDCPWYPTMTLFRQEIQDDWGSAFSKVELEVSRLLEASINDR